MASLHQEKLECSGLSLAIYLEIATHLRQLEGVKTELLSQQSQDFDYQQSQVGGLLLKYETNLDSKIKDKLEEILDFYAQRHGCWQRVFTIENK
jgi:hypothetical protein